MTTESPGRRCTGGLTLIELVIALAVLGLATGAIVGLVSVANRSSMTAWQFQQIQHNARVAVDRMHEEVRWGGAPAGSAGGFIEIGDEAFAVTVPQDPEYPACARPCRPYPEADPGRAYAVRFAFDPRTQTLRRQVDSTGRFDTSGWAPGAWTPGDGVVIADHVTGVRFAYFDRDGAPTTSPARAYRLSMWVQVGLGRHVRFLVTDVYLRQQ
jgi:type II secretory pathway pseudopilin PulG